MSSMTRLVSLLGIGAIITIGITFFLMAMGSIDGSSDMAGSAYEDHYDSVTEISIISVILMKFLPVIIGVCALLIAVVGLKRYAGM